MTLRSSATTLLSAAALLAAHAVMAQVPAVKPAPSKPLQVRPAPTPTAENPDRAAAYYHDGLAHLYEELAINNGRPDYAAQAVEEYKLALNADPGSKYLQDGLADLYFKIGRIREAVTAAQDQVKKNPNDLAAHTLLGKVYLRSLNDMQGPQATEMLQLAIAEYETLARLNPKDIETHLLLGQLYGVNHDTAKAQAQFKLAQGLDNNSEEAVLNMARLFTEQGEPQQAIDALTAIPAGDRSSRVDFALGASYDQLKKFKEAAAAYRAALDDEPDNPDTLHALATALLNDNQLPQALDIYQQLVKADPNDAQSQMKISEIERRQGHYDEALTSLTKAKSLAGNSDNLELAFQEAVLYDSLGKYDQAVSALQEVLAQTAKLDRKYSDPEKSNRAIFLDRLAIVYNEQNKTSDAIATFKQMIDLGGDFVIQGYDGEIDSYRNAHQWKDALAVSADLAKQFPKDPRVQLAYAQQLADAGQADQSLALANAQLNGSPQDQETLYDIAVIDFRLHRSAEALASLDKADALATRPQEHLGFELLRATILDRDKKTDEAEAEYKKALAIDPNNPATLNDYGYLLADHGVRLPEALDMIQKAVKLDPQNGAYLDSLGWVYFKLGQYGPAEDNLHRAIDRTPTDASIHDHLGELYEKTNRLKLAVDQWERSMTEYAHSLPADADPADIAKVKRKLEDARVKLARVSAVPAKKS
jgi:tetratricopeptide (TPR) repeat protein